MVVKTVRQVDATAKCQIIYYSNGLKNPTKNGKIVLNWIIKEDGSILPSKEFEIQDISRNDQTHDNGLVILILKLDGSVTEKVKVAKLLPFDSFEREIKYNFFGWEMDDDLKGSRKFVRQLPMQLRDSVFCSEEWKKSGLKINLDSKREV